MRSSLLPGLILGAIVLVVTPSPARGQNNVVNACANNSTGVIRVVFSGNTCKPNESPLSWNVAGQPGPKGDQGVQGLRARKETPAIKTSSPSVCREISRRRR